MTNTLKLLLIKGEEFKNISDKYMPSDEEKENDYLSTEFFGLLFEKL